MRRFLPLGIFGVIQAYVLISLSAAPAPWGVGAKVHSDTMIYVSCAAGVILIALALATALSDSIRFKTYLLISSIIGAALIAAAILTQGTPVGEGRDQASPILFFVYGGLLILSALVVKIPAPHSAEELRMHPHAP